MSRKSPNSPSGSGDEAVGANTIYGIVAPVAWTVETLNDTVDAEVADLPADMRARLLIQKAKEMDR